MEFKHMEIKEFNKKYGAELKNKWNNGGDFYEELLHLMDNDLCNASYFSASFDEADVIEDIEEEKEVAKNLKLELIEIENVFLAIY